MPVAASTIVTLAEIRLFLGMKVGEQTGRDDVLTSLLDEYNGDIENFIGVTMINTTYTESYDGDDTDWIFLEHYPIISVTSLSIDGTALSIVTDEDFYIYADMGEIKLDSTTFTSTNYKNVVFVYVAGYGIARANVPKVLKNALKTWVARVFKAEVVDFSQQFDESSLAHIKSQMMPWDIRQKLEYFACKSWGRK